MIEELENKIIDLEESQLLSDVKDIIDNLDLLVKSINDLKIKIGA